MSGSLWGWDRNSTFPSWLTSMSVPSCRRVPASYRNGNRCRKCSDGSVLIFAHYNGLYNLHHSKRGSVDLTSYGKMMKVFGLFPRILSVASFTLSLTPVPRVVSQTIKEPPVSIEETPLFPSLETEGTPVTSSVLVPLLLGYT